jgi:hypothetical protein
MRRTGVDIACAYPDEPVVLALFRRAGFGAPFRARRLICLRAGAMLER